MAIFMQKETTIHPTSFLSRLLFYPNFSKQSTFVEWTVCFGSQVVLDSLLRSLFQRPYDPLQIIQPIVNCHEFAVVTYVNRELESDARQQAQKRHKIPQCTASISRPHEYKAQFKGREMLCLSSEMSNVSPCA